MTINATEADIARFMSYVDKLPNGCWFWTGARSRGGGNRKWYGSFRVGGKVVRAHRFSCDIVGKKGPLPEGWHRDHSCCFSLCVNYEHLVPMTREQNQKLKMERRSAGTTEGNVNAPDRASNSSALAEGHG